MSSCCSDIPHIPPPLVRTWDRLLLPLPTPFLVGDLPGACATGHGAGAWAEARFEPHTCALCHGWQCPHSSCTKPVTPTAAAVHAPPAPPALATPAALAHIAWDPHAALAPTLLLLLMPNHCPISCCSKPCCPIFFVCISSSLY